LDYSLLRGKDDWGGLTRRAALLGLASAFTLGRASLALADAPTDRRFVVVNLRGALDGLSAVVPYGDAALTDPRGELMPPAPGEDGGVLDLGGFYSLHPALANLHAMYRTGEALAVHAVAGPYRARSHFEAQDLLEGGTDHRMTSGSLTRRGAFHHPRRAVAIGVRCRCCCVVQPVWQTGRHATPHAMISAASRAQRDDSVLGPRSPGAGARGFSTAVLSNDEPARNRNAFLSRQGRRRISAPTTALASPHWRSAAGIPMRGSHSAWLARCANSTPGWRL
jgi:hypothetical protein